MTYEIPEESRPQMSKFRRRAFLARGGGLAIAAALGMHVPFGRHFPAGLMPVAPANGLLDEYGKDKELIILGDKPFVAETPAHLLDEEVTSTRLMFVRNNGLLPDREQIDPRTWTLTIDGESVASSKTFMLAQLKSQFENITRQLTLECGGNGRSEFFPPAKGNQWTYGGVGFPTWTGIRLRDVLTAAGVKNDAVYIGYYGADVHLSGDPGKPVISRGVPIAKAMDDESLLVWGMNGAELPLAHGYPLRLVFSGRSKNGRTRLPAPLRGHCPRRDLGELLRHGKHAGQIADYFSQVGTSAYSWQGPERSRSGLDRHLTGTTRGSFDRLWPVVDGGTRGARPQSLCAATLRLGCRFSSQGILRNLGTCHR
jgi:DMSO/TMAO reductase YedYZ molybdopterin-dependent catalytic subunit